MENKKFSDYTEQEFLDFIKDICYVNKTIYPTEKSHEIAVEEFERLTEHPDGSDLIYYPSDEREDSPEGILNVIKKWRAENGRPGFKE
ncbi:bacteriocin immunity protein [Yersinia bercovieri]|uniref:bacteriocin immunity protein n=1 Tax=Yersinia bercovieri TaxID=634 RepID=UPI0011AB7C39|nr:bacteriocin immunity protein [Yersinia bercovieri]